MQSVSDIFHPGKGSSNLSMWMGISIYIVVPRCAREFYTLQITFEKYPWHDSRDSKISLLVRWIWKG